MTLDPDMANFHAITPFPGTDLYDNLKQYGTISGEFTDFTYQGAAFIPRRRDPTLHSKCHSCKLKSAATFNTGV